MDLSGVWKSNDGSLCYLRQVENELWWFSENHERQRYDIFKGLVIGESVEGEWVSTPKGRNRDSGKLILTVKGNKLVSHDQKGIFKDVEWKKENLIGLFTNPAFNHQSHFLTVGFNEADNITGGWIGDDSDFYYLREIGETVWGLGEHPKRNWLTVFKGVVRGDYVKGEWIDLLKMKKSGKGVLELKISPDARIITRLAETGGFTGVYFHKLTGIYYPGELGFDEDYHPATWNIKVNDRSGLNLPAYDTGYRPAYIQNVAPDAATVIWRVGLPAGTNPDSVIESIKAEVLLAPRGTPIANGERFSTRNGIEVSDCSWAYDTLHDQQIYPSQNHNFKVKIDLRLPSLHNRPAIQFKIRFRNLQPGTVYHYRIKSDFTDSSAALCKEQMDYLTLGNDIYFKTADLPNTDAPVRFLAMGDLGPGKRNPCYFYDVFDLFHDVVRNYSPDFWLAPGDLDNYWGGNPNAMDPFFFNVYNAYLNRNFGNPPRWSCAYGEKAAETKIKAFQRPPYYGILGGLPIYPAVGNHDLKGNGITSLESWRKAYLSNFDLPSEGGFNQAGQGLFYTFRYNNVILIALAIPGPTEKAGRPGFNWWNEWGFRQLNYLQTYLKSLRDELSDANTWLVVYFHDHHWAYSPTNELQYNFARLLAKLGVDLVIMGHQHFFAHKTVVDGEFDYRAVVVGTGGFGSTNPCKRPGFIMANIYRNTLEYWKFDTHRCGFQGIPENREALAPAVREYCAIKKLGFGKHEIKEMDLNAVYRFKNS
ncbi:MAG: hypothetical protein GX075_13480 [Firmicutes bacterium]|nr:hypothetical protein [Bacillota bacterium]